MSRLNMRGNLRQIRRIMVILGSLSNHDDDGNKKPTNLHILK